MAEWIARRRLSYLTSQAITFPAIADELRSKASAPDLKAFLSFGMQVRDDQRRHVNEILNIPVIELYGSEECGAIAHQCPDARRYFMSCPSWSWSRSLMATIARVRPGCQGASSSACFTTRPSRSFATNRAISPSLESQCPCGRGLTRDHKGSGTGAQSLSAFPTARHSAQAFRRRPSSNILHARWWQVAQVARDAIEIRFHPQQDVTQKNTTNSAS